MKKINQCIFLLMILLFSTNHIIFAQGFNFDEYKDYDGFYTKNFTASGTIEFVPSLSGDIPPSQKRWHISFSQNELAYEEEIVKFLDWFDFFDNESAMPPKSGGKVSGTYRTTICLNDKISGKYEIYGATNDNALTQWNSGQAPALVNVIKLDKSDSQAFTLFPNVVLWGMGRGYSKSIKKIVSVEKMETGMLSILADGMQFGGNKETWELLIDSKNTYIVRSAKRYLSGQLQMQFKNSGVCYINSCLIPKTMELIDYRFNNMPITRHVTVDDAKFEKDTEFINTSMSKMSPTYDDDLMILDSRKKINTAEPKRPFQKIPKNKTDDGYI